MLTFLLAGLALNLTPGPDMIYVIARSAGEGKRAGVVSALGIAVGSLFHTAVVAFGAAALFVSRPGAFRFIQLAGAGYLIYLGIRALLSAKRTHAAPELARAPLRAVFYQGVVTNILNPKVILFFFAFLPQFTNPDAGPVWLQIVGLGLLFNVTGTLVNILVALGAGHLADRMRSRAAARLRQVTGAILVALGLRLAFLRS